MRLRLGQLVDDGDRFGDVPGNIDGEQFFGL